MKFINFLDKVADWIAKLLGIGFVVPATKPKPPETPPISPVTPPPVTIPPKPEEVAPPPVLSPSEKLYWFAKSQLGKDISKTQDELGCVESLCFLLRNCFGEKEPNLFNTIELATYLANNPKYKKVEGPELGAIIINVTGSGNGTLKHGHVGIVGKQWIMSNDSSNSRWSANYNTASWYSYFEKVGGMPTMYYQRIK